MARGMVPAFRDNRPRSSKENHRKTTPDRPTEAFVGTNLRLTPFRRGVNNIMQYNAISLTDPFRNRENARFCMGSGGCSGRNRGKPTQPIENTCVLLGLI